MEEPVDRSFASESERLRHEMVEYQIRRRGIRSPRVLRAMEKIPREVFMEPDTAHLAYRDCAHPIGEEQTISQPFVVALMADALKIEPDHKILEIGTGSGYALAVMAQLCDQAFGIERFHSLTVLARERLRKLEIKNAHIRQGDGTRGWPEEAPFDGISVAAGATQIPDALLDQLKVGGRLVIPVGALSDQQDLIVLQKTGENEFVQKNLGPVAFVPLISDT